MCQPNRKLYEEDEKSVLNTLVSPFQFTLFILLALAAEYLQLHHYHNPTLKNPGGGAWQQLELAWHGLERPEEVTQDCCDQGDAAADYKRLHLLVPESCYQATANDTAEKTYPHDCLQMLDKSRRYIHQRDKLYMWAIVGLEVGS